MEYFKKILQYALPYRKYGFLNIFFNILYALFSALSFAALIPMLDVLFDKTTKVYEHPVYSDMGNLKEYLQDTINYRVTSFAGDDEMKGLILVIGLVLVLFLLKNIFRRRRIVICHFHPESGKIKISRKSCRSCLKK